MDLLQKIKRVDFGFYSKEEIKQLSVMEITS